MASIRKRGSSYLLVVSMGYDFEGNRIRPKQKTVHPPEGLTPKQKEKWLNEQAVLFERECKGLPQEVDRSITLAKYTELWLREIAPGKLAKSTLARERQDIDRFLPVLGNGGFLFVEDRLFLAVLVLKDPQAADLVGHLDGLGLGVVGAHPQQHQEPLADLPVDPPLDGDGGVLHPCDNCAHINKFLSSYRYSRTKPLA